MKGEESVIKAEATSEIIEFHCNFSIDEPTKNLVSHRQTLLEKSLVTLAVFPCAGRMQFDDV